RPAPGAAEPAPGDVYALVRVDGRPAAAVLGRYEEGEDPAEALAALAAKRLADATTPRTDAERLAAEDPATATVPPRASVVVAT
ncbi:glycosyltransferase family 2 protein, partial [Streptomyces hydrogenans]